MSKRSTWLLLALGLFALYWGLFALERIFVDERAQAHARATDEQDTLAEYARRTLEQQLQESLHAAEPTIMAARADPLHPAQGLLLVEDGRQRLPRRDAARAGTDATARELYAILRAGQLPQVADPTSPWAKRVRLFALFRRVLHDGDRGAIEETAREILEHRAYYLIDPEKDIPYTVAMLDELVEHSDPSPSLLTALVREGLALGAGPRIDGLQITLLRSRERLSAPDFAFLGERIASLGRRFAVPTDDFVARRDAAPDALVPVPDPMTHPSLLLGGTWYAAPRAGGRVVGLRVDLWAAVRDTEDKMHARALLGEEDRLVMPPLSGVVDLAHLPLLVESPRFVAAHRDADARFWLKTGFVAASAAFGLLLGAMALLFQHRKQRFVELKSDFVATVSHELRTPLASIRLMAETLQRRTKGVPEVRDYPERIVKDIDELAFLVENILSFNRLDKGRWQPRPSAVDLGALLDEVHDELGSFGFSDVVMHTEGVDGVTLHADRELLKLLFRNLAKNACTHNERAPVVLDVRARDGTRGQLVIEVTDNGVGIAPAEQRRVFDDFHRGSKGRARGSGLGLSIARRTMQAHGGSIGIAQSSAAGTTFRLAFPATMVIERP